MYKLHRNLFLAIVFCTALVAGMAQAADYTWTGASSTDLSEAANWSPVPTEAFYIGDNLIFPSGVTATNLTSTSLLQISSITFQTGAPSYNLSGSSFKFASVYNESDADQTVLNNLDWQQFSKTYSNNGFGTLKLARIFSTKPGKSLVLQTFTGTGDIIVSYGMTAGGTPFEMEKNGSGKLTIQNTYDYKIGTSHNCTIMVNAGTLDVTDMDIKFEDYTSDSAPDWSSLPDKSYTLIDYSNGAIVVNGSSIFGSVTGLDGSDFVLGHDTDNKKVYIYIPPTGTVISIR